jgi:signal transduction histidine kinase
MGKGLLFARRKAKRATPVFFWQAVLILLPVAVMTGFGFWAILKERNAVEQDAQQRAREILSPLRGDFGIMAAGRLTELDSAKDGWFHYLQSGVMAWPESRNRKQFLGDLNELQIISNNIARLHSALPQWQGGPVPLFSFLLDTNGDVLFGHPIPPRPPEWLAALYPAQQQAWNELQSGAYANEPVSNLVEALRSTHPPASALACAEFVQLEAAVPSMPATNAVDQLLLFARRHDSDISESGLPLRTLALAAALKLARDSGPNERLWEGLQSEISSPTAFTPILLDEAGRLVVGDETLLESVHAMRILLAEKLAQADLAEAVKETGEANSITITTTNIWLKAVGVKSILATNLWANAMGQRWFCILSSSAFQSWTTISNHYVTTITPITRVRCYPEPVVARGIADALQAANVSLPGYFSIAVKVEGEAIPLPPPWSNIGDGKPVGDILADEQFQMSQRAGTTIGYSGNELVEKKAMLLTQPFSKEGANYAYWEDMPGHPEFSLQIRLTDRSLLYARQRQLQLVFGALIAASALAALVGLAAAYLSFRREQALNEMKTNFVSSVSHELRAPIASVRLMAENLECGKVPESARQVEYFRFIGQECRRLSSLIENVLDFSRIEQGRKQYEFEPTDLMALTQTTVKLMEPYAAEKGVTLQLNLVPELLPANKLELEVDGRAIQQALVNLIDNAIKHSAKGQTVRVELGPWDHGSVSLAVSDDGPGIPVAERERIFERFYRLGSELRRETQGIGIGLSIVKHIVEAHGGRVMVESEPGTGSRFTIILPAGK